MKEPILGPGKIVVHLCVNTLPASWQSVYTQM